LLAQGIAKANHGGLRAVNLVLNALGLSAVFWGQGRNVGEEFGIAEDGGERIADFVGGASRKAAEGDEFFGVRDLLLDSVEIFDGIGGEFHKVAEFVSQQIELPIDESAQEEHSAENQAQTECGYVRRNIFVVKTEDGDNGQRENAQHGAAGSPDALAQFTIRPLIGDRLQGWARSGKGNEKKDRQQKGSVVKTSRIIPAGVDGYTEEQIATGD
jgi:hypothetical protein